MRVFPSSVLFRLEQNSRPREPLAKSGSRRRLLPNRASQAGKHVSGHHKGTHRRTLSREQGGERLSFSWGRTFQSRAESQRIASEDALPSTTPRLVFKSSAGGPALKSSSEWVHSGWDGTRRHYLAAEQMPPPVRGTRWASTFCVGSKQRPESHHPPPTKKQLKLPRSSFETPKHHCSD